MNEIIGIIIAAIICWLNFVVIDTYFGLPEQPGVLGAKIVGQDVEKRGGDIAGGFFQGNILCSPDASAGTLLASIGYLLLGIPGGIIAAFFVFIGNRLCADPGYAGTFPVEFECEIYLNLSFTLFYKSLSRCYSPDCS